MYTRSRQHYGKNGSPGTPSSSCGTKIIDLKLVRRLLESSGYDNILLPDKNDRSLLYLLRQDIFEGVPEDKRFYLKLEAILALMFPRLYLKIAITLVREATESGKRKRASVDMEGPAAKRALKSSQTSLHD
ncbi:hypothetical protein BJ170DRAFT_597059 [Xylariales sp. AK1849]|nr:hypothetical protein BJ170DRAFT_597059 [Xylariales sp. AK1849]